MEEEVIQVHRQKYLEGAQKILSKLAKGGYVTWEECEALNPPACLRSFNFINKKARSNRNRLPLTDEHKALIHEGKVKSQKEREDMWKPIRETFINNGYPLHILNNYLSKGLTTTTLKSIFYKGTCPRLKTIQEIATFLPLIERHIKEGVLG